MTKASPVHHLDDVEQRSGAVALAVIRGARYSLGHAPRQAVEACCSRRIVVRLSDRGYPQRHRVKRSIVGRLALMRGGAHHVDTRTDMLRVCGQSLAALHLAPRIGDGLADQIHHQALHVRNSALKGERFNRFEEFHGEISLKRWADEVPFSLRLHQSISGNFPTQHPHDDRIAVAGSSNICVVVNYSESFSISKTINFFINSTACTDRTVAVRRFQT